MSRDPEMFIKPELIQQFKEGCKQVGHTVIITSVDRNRYEQTALYYQGRYPLNEVNECRQRANMLPITEAHNKIVTWTLNSNHIPDSTGKSHAFDFAIVKDGKVCWDVKADVDQDGASDYGECGQVAEGLGLRWGGRFRKPDMPHCETI